MNKRRIDYAIQRIEERESALLTWARDYFSVSKITNVSLAEIPPENQEAFAQTAEKIQEDCQLFKDRAVLGTRAVVWDVIQELSHRELRYYLPKDDEV